ncbi:MAG: MopE-related protein [Archangium sp.]
MSRFVGILMVALCACGADRTFRVENISAPASASACELDSDCGDGLLCEACGDGFKTCVPGCREDSQCGPNMICDHNVQCLSCPCPSGWCDLDPCRDLDGDGFAPATDGMCPGKQLGDCNDALASVKPGGRERCQNGQDDDCNGKKDRNDDACRDTCDQGLNFCANSRYCRSDEFCDVGGCCEKCDVPVVPTCDAGMGFLQGGLDENGCSAALVCVDLNGCSGVNYEPVCARNFATYDNACLAELAGSRVLHRGNCLYLEGERCDFDEYCSGATFCRNMSLDGGDDFHCVQRGTCSTDADCLHVNGTIPCGDGGVATFACERELCVGRCP